jgi:hypothetical protein
MEFLDFLFFAIIGIYIIRSLMRIILPMIFQNVINKAQQQQNNQRNYNSSTTQGKIKVDYMPKPKKGSVPDSEGDFIDYEEIK